MPSHCGLDGMFIRSELLPCDYGAIVTSVFHAVPFRAAMTIDAELVVGNREPFWIDKVATRVTVIEWLNVVANPREANDAVLAVTRWQLR